MTIFEMKKGDTHVRLTVYSIVAVFMLNECMPLQNVFKGLPGPGITRLELGVN